MFAKIGGCNSMATYLLIHHVAKHLGARQANKLVVATVGALKLHDDPLQQQLADLGHLGVDHRNETGIYVRERRGGHLRLHEGTAQNTASANDILSKKFRDDILDVGNVDLVDETVDGLTQGVPLEPLHPLIVTDRPGFCLLLHHSFELERRDVCSTYVVKK